MIHPNDIKTISISVKTPEDRKRAPELVQGSDGQPTLATRKRRRGTKRRYTQRSDGQETHTEGSSIVKLQQLPLQSAKQKQSIQSIQPIQPIQPAQFILPKKTVTPVASRLTAIPAAPTKIVIAAKTPTLAAVGETKVAALKIVPTKKTKTKLMIMSKKQTEKAVKVQSDTIGQKSNIIGAKKVVATQPPIVAKKVIATQPPVESIPSKITVAKAGSVAVKAAAANKKTTKRYRERHIKITL